MTREKQPDPRHLGKFLWFFIKKQWYIFLPIQITAMAWAAENTVWPYYLKTIIDTLTGLTGKEADIAATLIYLVVFGSGLWILFSVCFRSMGIMNSYAYPRIEANIRKWIFDYVQQHSHNYFSNNFAGNLANKVGDLARSSSMIIRYHVHLLLPSFASFLVVFIIFLTRHPVFGGVFSVWVIFHLAVLFYFAKKCADLSKIHSESRSHLNGQVVDSLTNHMNVRLFSKYKHEYNRIGLAQEDERYKNHTTQFFIEKIKILTDIIGLIFVFGGLVGFTLYAWHHNYITVGDVALIFNTSWNILFVIWVISMELPEVYREMGVAHQALTLAIAQHDVQDQADAQPLQVSKGQIEFRDVHFEYVKGQNLFEDSNLIIQPGQKVGLIGFSGSGKTTFVNLILRLFDLQSGQIEIDGQDISKVQQLSLREKIAMIPQDTSLFHRSLLENIRYGREDATDEEVHQASLKANCDEFIKELPQTYETLVGERGIKLSGGQRQRIAIARAILKNAPILILDEATSALDTVTEKHIQASLSELMQGKTTLVVAHRLSTLLSMDRILVFDAGKIIEDGSHEELISQDGHYAKLWKMQTGGELKEGQL